MNDADTQVWVCVMFAALSIDRANIGNATSDGLLADLGITQADYVGAYKSLALTARIWVSPYPKSASCLPNSLRSSSLKSMPSPQYPTGQTD